MQHTIERFKATGRARGFSQPELSFAGSGGAGFINRREFCVSIAAAVAAPAGILKSSDGFSCVRQKAIPLAPPPVSETSHRIFFEPSQQMKRLDDASVDLVVTSPPYPMITMWDGIFAAQNGRISDMLRKAPDSAFELMHAELDKVWAECFRVLRDGCFMCVNVGDATRTINKDFRLYNNHSRVVLSCLKTGFANLPNIIWRKQTNAPNKFMGSGMLPCGAYVTLEHEWILVFRKNGKRSYSSEKEKALRRSSAFFWEERNKWFSDLWEIKGARQVIANSKTRERNGSFPLEIPFRLVNMYSQIGDTVLDPFTGMGTTTIAALLSGRNSVGFEIDKALEPSIGDFIGHIDAATMNRMASERLERHVSFVKEREDAGKEIKYFNRRLNCKVMTSQETDMEFVRSGNIVRADGDGMSYRCFYK